MLLLRVLLLAFTVLLQNKNTTLIAENGEKLITAQPRISAHSQGPKIDKRPGRFRINTVSLQNFAIEQRISGIDFV